MPTRIKFGVGRRLSAPMYTWEKYQCVYTWVKYNAVSTTGWMENGNNRTAIYNSDSRVEYVTELPNGPIDRNSTGFSSALYLYESERYTVTYILSGTTDDAKTKNVVHPNTAEAWGTGAAFRVIYSGPQLTYQTILKKGGTSYGNVASNQNTTYPLDGAKDGYWYTYSSVARDEYLGTVTASSKNEYPSNGIQNGYWYILKN